MQSRNLFISIDSADDAWCVSFLVALVTSILDSDVFICDFNS